MQKTALHETSNASTPVRQSDRQRNENEFKLWFFTYFSLSAIVTIANCCRCDSSGVESICTMMTMIHVIICRSLVRVHDDCIPHIFRCVVYFISLHLNLFACKWRRHRHCCSHAMHESLNGIKCDDKQFIFYSFNVVYATTSTVTNRLGYASHTNNWTWCECVRVCERHRHHGDKTNEWEKSCKAEKAVKEAKMCV